MKKILKRIVIILIIILMILSGKQYAKYVIVKQVKVQIKQNTINSVTKENLNAKNNIILTKNWQLVQFKI